MSAYKDLDKKDRTDFYIALAVIISVLCFVLYYSFTDLFSDKEVTFLQSGVNDIHLHDTLIVDGATYVPLDKNIASDQSSNEHSEDLESNVTLDSSSLNIITPEKIEEPISEASILQTDSENIVENAQEQKLDSVLVDEQKILETNIDTVINKVVVDTILKESKKEVSVARNINSDEDRSCIIAVGIYRNERNANKMLDRLKEAGYDAFSISRKNRYRVQVYHSCDNKSLNQSLTSIRNNYAADALVLIKE